MDRRTLEVFINTCDYLGYLIDEIMSSNSEMPSEIVLATNNVMAKLFRFMNHLLESKGKLSLSGNVNCSPVNFQPDSWIHQMQYDNTTVGGSTNQTFPPFDRSLTYGPPPASGQLYLNPESQFSQNISNGSNYYGSSPSNFGSSNSAPSKKASSVNTSSKPVKNTPVSKSSVKNNIPSTSQTNKKASPLQPPPPAMKEKSSPYGSVASQSKPSSKASSEGTTPASKSQSTSAKVVPNKSNPPQVDLSCDITVTKVFDRFTNTILDGSVTKANMGIYCALCDCLCLKPWYIHVGTQGHYFNSRGQRKRQLFYCYLCDISIFGNEDIILKYFEYHFRKIHFGKTEYCWEEILEIVSEAELIANCTSTSSSTSSLNKNSSAGIAKKNNKTKKKNKECTTSSPGFTTNEVPATNKNAAKSKGSDVKPVASNAAATSSKNAVSQMRSSNVQTMTDTVSTRSDSAISSSSSLQYSEFESVIAQMSEEWIKSSIKLSAGFCDVCQVGILSAFDWFSHVENHNVQNPSKWKEEICRKCEIKVYGSNPHLYFNLPSHCELDKKM